MVQPKPGFKDIRSIRAFMLRGLDDLYGPDECKHVVEWVFYFLAGIGKMEFVTNPERVLETGMVRKLLRALKELQQGRPVQYVTGKTEFFGLTITVDERVLIPRPETEELVKWVIDDHPHARDLKILDIGTGSGCISIALQKFLPGNTIHAFDISPEAIRLARKNATTNSARILFYRADILQPHQGIRNMKYEVIVSNPPYVTEGEKKLMKENVLDHEPQIALFVPDDDPLVYYRAIAEFARKNLSETGRVYVEINERFGRETDKIFSNSGFSDVTVKKDLQGKDRMIRAVI